MQYFCFAVTDGCHICFSPCDWRLQPWSPLDLWKYRLYGLALIGHSNPLPVRALKTWTRSGVAHTTSCGRWVTHIFSVCYADKSHSAVHIKHSIHQIKHSNRNIQEGQSSGLQGLELSCLHTLIIVCSADLLCCLWHAWEYTISLLPV